MKEVYIVYEWKSWEPQEVRAVFLSEDKAKEMVSEKLTPSYDVWRYEEHEVEE